MAGGFRGWAGAMALIGLAAQAGSALAAGHRGMTKGVADSALAAVGRQTPLKAIDYDQVYCDADLTVETWLKTLTGANARSIDWSAGRCKLANDLGPLDSGSDWCAQASITLAHPKDRDDTATVEVYFEKPVKGRPGPAYAFRGVMVTADGPDYTRFRKDFEAEWIQRFGAPASACQDPDN
jgi:hypothetical protein